MAGAPQIVVLGVGNVLMTDEGVGVHAVEALEKGYAFPPNVRCVDGGTSTQELLGDFEDLDHLIVIDAVASNSAPGSILRLTGAAVPAAFTTKLSPHQIGIADLLATLAFMGRAPKAVVLFGVEPAVIELGMELSPLVKATVAPLCEQVLEELRGLGQAVSPRAPLAAGAA